MTRKIPICPPRKKMNENRYEELLKTQKKLIFTPGGKSMVPMLGDRKNTVVILPVSEGQKIKKYDVIFYKRDNGQYVLHRVIKKQKNSFVLCGDGQYVKEYGVRRDMILGKLDGFFKGEKYIRMDSTSIVIYSRLRVASRPVRALFCRAWHLVKRAFRRP